MAQSSVLWERLKPLLLASVVMKVAVIATVLTVQAQVAPQANLGRAPLAYPVPNSGSAIVDGDPGEWDLAADFFANMYRAGNPNFTVLSKLYLRYDCATETLYLLLLAEPGRRIESFHTAAENWAKVNNVLMVSNLSGNNGTPPDFSYIGSDGCYADGWEASFVINPGNYTSFNVHAQVNDGSAGGQTSAVANRSILLNLSCTLGSIGDYVWHDADGEGDQDEPPANGLGGVRVRLLNGALTQVIAVTTTDANGYYLFPDLTAGDYVVDVNEQDVINLYGLPALTTNNEPYPYSLAAGEHHRDADFGYWAPPGTVALGDYVWHDYNSNGKQDFPAEAPENAGVQCISIFLYDGNGDYLDRTNTDSWGIYMFYDLPPGTYTTVVYATDPDLAQIGGTRTCSLDDGTPPLALSLQLRAPETYYFTTVTQLTYPVMPAGTINLDFDYGLSETPLAVVLSDFGALQVNEHVLVSWETLSEINNAGFNLYRFNDSAGPQTLLAYLPSSAPGGSQGAAYSYADWAVQAGQTYEYWLEDVSLSGATTLHGPVSVTVQAPTAVTFSGVSAGPAAIAALPWPAVLTLLFVGVLAGVIRGRRQFSGR